MRLLALTLIAAASPVAAQVRVVPDQPKSASAARAGVDVFLINESDQEAPANPPAQIEVTAADAARIAMVPAETAPATIPPHGFARVRYLAAGVVDVRRPPVLPTFPGPALALADRDPSAPVEPELTVASSNGKSSGFWDRIDPYEPIYGVFGTNDAGAKLQFSLALRPFGGSGALSHLKLAYTQTMLWRIDLPSGPFRNTTYSPEVFADVPVSDSLTIGGGYRHDSNGRGPSGSIDVNRVYLRAAKSFDLGDDWSLELMPQAWFYIDHRGAYALDRYWGFTSLKASIGQTDGLKLSVTGRGDVRSQRGAAEAFVSYPLGKLGDGIGLYLFGQAFTGYGEALDDYRLRTTRARLGISLTR